MNEEELLKRSAAERDRIFSCYDRGREGAEIDPWEDPGYEVYHATDRYGFIQYVHMHLEFDRIQSIIVPLTI